MQRIIRYCLHTYLFRAPKEAWNHSTKDSTYDGPCQQHDQASLQKEHFLSHFISTLFLKKKFGFYFKDQQSESDHSQQHGQPPGASRSQARTGSRISNQSSHSKNKRSSIASLPASLLNLGEVIENVSISWHGVLEFFSTYISPHPLNWKHWKVRNKIFNSFSIWINELKIVINCNIKTFEILKSLIKWYFIRTCNRIWIFFYIPLFLVIKTSKIRILRFD